MKVLLTGANGFVGSHILDALLERGLRVSILLRNTSDPAFIAHHLEGAQNHADRTSAPQAGTRQSTIESSQSLGISMAAKGPGAPAAGSTPLHPANPKLSIICGSIEEPATLPIAVKDVTHVIHCAGRTKACKPEEFYRTNQHGTRNIVDAVNASGGRVQRLLHVSSLAVVGPSTPEKPAREDSPAVPVSHYGRSKLAAEKEVTENCRTDYAIVRPPAVYGPRDHSFLPLFKAVKNHIFPGTNPRQTLSLVYVKDLAQAVVETLLHPAARKRTYFAASPEIITARQMASQIAKCLGTWTVPVPLPALALWPLCLGQELLSMITHTPKLLNLQKYAELRAAGWVCDTSRLRREIGYTCTTDLCRGVAQTLTWYQKHHWL